MVPDPQKQNNFSRIAIRGAGWYYTSFFSGKLISFLTTVILARLLSKDDFGIVAYALTFIAFLEVMNEFGVGVSVIYHEESERVWNTSFWLTIFIGLILFAVSYLSAPLVGVYFKDSRVIPLIQVLGLTFPLSALGGTHSFILQKKLKFGLRFLPDLLQGFAKGLLSISLAMLAFGPWSLVVGQIGGVLVWVVAMWFITPWKPRLDFNGKTARSLLAYGSKMVGVDIIAIASTNMDYLFVGRFLGAEALGVYTLAFRLPDLLIIGFARIVSNVTFPIFMKMKDTRGSLLRGFYSTTKYVALISVPLGIGLALLARPFTLLVFTEKWIDLVPVIQALSIYALLNSLVYVSGTLFKSEGRPEIIIWREILHIALLFPAFWWAVIFSRSIVAVGWMHALVSFILDFVTIGFGVHVAGVTWKETFESIKPSLLASIPMVVTVQLTLTLIGSLSSLLQLLLAVLVGFLTYVTSLWFLQRDLVLEVSRRVREAGGKWTVD